MRIKLFILFLLVTFQLQAQYSETETLIQKKLKADLLTPDSLNGDGVYKVRHRKTGKWGMCQAYSSKKINLLIPLEYDDVLFFPPNGKFTAVFKDGKLGIYLSYWSYGKKAKQTIPCIFDDFQRISYNYQWYLALKKEGKWGWVDFISGEEKSGFVYENVKDLPESDWR